MADTLCHFRMWWVSGFGLRCLHGDRCSWLLTRTFYFIIIILNGTLKIYGCFICYFVSGDNMNVLLCLSLSKHRRGRFILNIKCYRLIEHENLRDEEER